MTRPLRPSHASSRGARTQLPPSHTPLVYAVRDATKVEPPPAATTTPPAACRSFGTSPWLGGYQLGAAVVFTAWWRHLDSHAVEAITLPEIEVLAFIKLPASFAAGAPPRG